MAPEMVGHCTHPSLLQSAREVKEDSRAGKKKATDKQAKVGVQTNSSIHGGTPPG